MSASLNVFNIRSGMQKVFFIKKHRYIIDRPRSQGDEGSTHVFETISTTSSRGLLIRKFISPHMKTRS
ncbi:Uncharacterized protein APZ42_014520 [Daphnia magna]|uniref:Uncharacterized protein n=1 Tax=Daphnia magna TaxID=35525 RepID=A0A162PUC1_9CRUS|nr:Uncharacterized protein APZ42_014520 [Daphnia magna]